VAVEDGARDARPWNPVQPGEPHPPSGDLRRFEIRADEAGVCARWTTAAPAPVGAQLVLAANGPPIEMPGGAVVKHGHGFTVELERNGGVVTYGLDRLGSDAPRVLRARVRGFGRTVSVFVPRAELDVPPANMPDRPAFPFREITFEARVITPPGRDGGQVADFLPDEGGPGDHGLVNGRLCPAPCEQLGF
jgi:hypothetical protein